jgi:hypothetical protein
MKKDANAKPKTTQKKFSLTPFWNIMAVLMILGTCCVSTYVLILLTNPQLPVNPFPPALTSTPTPTSTFTPRVFPATWTPTSTYSAEQPSAALPPPTLGIYFTPTKHASMTPPPPTATLHPGPWFSVDGLITAIPATDKNTDVGCSWLGIGGVIVDSSNQPLFGITVKLTGSLDFTSYDQTTLSGAAPQYGEGGYEFYLGGSVSASQGRLFIQLMDDTGQQLSDPISITTYSDCQKNLILVNFKQLQ